MAIAPRVAIMDNGATKRGTRSVWGIIDNSPDIENLWQLHFSEEGGATYNPAQGEIVWSRVFVENGKLKADIGRARSVELPDSEVER
jgi:hypothetical protein